MNGSDSIYRPTLEGSEQIYFEGNHVELDDFLSIFQAKGIIETIKSELVQEAQEIYTSNKLDIEQALEAEDSSDDEETPTKNYMDGSQYKGKIEQGLKSGLSEIKYSINSSYKGTFEKGLRHGKGIMHYRGTSSILVPLLDEDYEDRLQAEKSRKRFPGESLSWKDFYIYNGEWQHDMRHGTGVMEFYDGVQIIGKWEKG